MSEQFIPGQRVHGKEPHSGLTAAVMQNPSQHMHECLPNLCCSACIDEGLLRMASDIEQSIAGVSGRGQRGAHGQTVFANSVERLKT